jgi:PiT family inorganic phosphate transporter
VPVALAALIAAIFWNVLTWLLGIPSSSSHALIGGFVGAAIAGYGLEVIRIEGLIKVLAGLFISPILGMIIGWMIMRVVLFFGQAMTPRVSIFFQRSQWLTMITLGLSHGSNDAQKTMGILAMGLLAFGAIPSFYVPFWVILACAAAIALGSALGGWRLIRTMGGRFYKIRPRHALCSQVASTAVILGAALLGGPVSSTQVISSTIVGVGAAERMPMVRWGVVGQILTAWLLTIPATCIAGALIFWAVDVIL